MDMRVPSCVLYVAMFEGGSDDCVCLSVCLCVCAADIDIPLAAEAEPNVFKVSGLSSQPGAPEVQKREGK